MTMKKRRTYTEEFKTDTVSLVLSGRPAAEVARDLGIDVSNINRWKTTQLQKQDALHCAQGPMPSDLAAENKRLRQQLAEQKQIVEILKKTIKYVS